MLELIRQTICLPIICKILLFINITLFVLELVFDSLDLSYCLSPKRILLVPGQYISSLFVSNFLHLNPRRMGPTVIYHILLNMMTLIYMAPTIEKTFGSIAFIGITLFFVLFIGPLQMAIGLGLEAISKGYITLFSLYPQCSIGFSGILFGYFIIYLQVAPDDEFDFYGLKCKKWVLPFAQLFVLSFFLQCSFVAHLTGIIMGIVYILGVPGAFEQRQRLVKQIESWKILRCVTNGHGFYAASQEPILTKFKFIPSTSGLCKFNSKKTTIGYSKVNIGDTQVEMTSLEAMIDDDDILFNSHD